jgi:type I restriction enzyme S subunit
MMENKFKLGDLFFPVAVAIKDAKDSPYDKFVGLEHYDSLEPVINRFTDTSLLSSSVKEFHTGDMLIARRNVYLRRAGLALFDGLTSGDSIVLRLRQENEIPEGLERDVLSRILPFVLNSENFWIYANKHADGMNSKRISIDNLLNYEFELPVIDEQKVLAEKLWAAYEVKQSYLKMIDATQEMVKAQFNEIVGDTQTNIHHWPIKKLPEIAEYTIGLTYKPDDVKEDGTIVLRSGNIKESSIDLEDIVRVVSVIKDSLFVKVGDILMCSRNGSASLVGKVAQIKEIQEPMTFGAFMTIIRSIYSDYLFLFFQSNDFRKQISGGKSSTMNQITRYMLDEIVIPFPDYESIEKLSKILYQADKSISELRKSIDAIDKVIKSLISENL